MDAEIVRRAQDGDAWALEELFRLALRLSRDAAAADDLVTEALERGGLRLGKLRDTGAAQGWFARILVNLWRDRLRARRIEEPSLDSVPEPQASWESDPAEGVRMDELRREVAEAVLRLPEAQRAVMALRIDLELSVKEIATVLDSTVARVKANLWHARQRLRRELRDYLDESSEISSWTDDNGNDDE